MLNKNTLGLASSINKCICGTTTIYSLGVTNNFDIEDLLNYVLELHTLLISLITSIISIDT